jgi:hypothetical protein
VSSQGLCIFSPAWWKICITTNSAQHIVFTLSMLHKQCRKVHIIQTIPQSGTKQMYKYNCASISICVFLLHLTPKISKDYIRTDQCIIEKIVYTNCFVVIVVYMESHTQTQYVNFC